MKFWSLILSLLFLVSCGSSQSTPRADIMELDFESHYQIPVVYAMARADQALDKTLKKIGDSRSASTSSINADRPGYLLEINNGVILGEFPYYGKRTSGYRPRADENVKFLSRVADLEIKSGSRKNYNYYRFSLTDSADATESYDVSIKVYEDKQAKIQISSSRRSPIEYRGYIMEL